MTNWKRKKIGDFLTLQRGYDITKICQNEGFVPVVSSSGINSYHNEAKAKGPGVVIGRKGTLGTAFYVDTDYWPHDTSLYVKDFKGNDSKFVYYLLKALPLHKLDSGSANPTLNRNVVHQVIVNFPNHDTQQKISKTLSTLDQKIELNNRINRELEGLAKLLYDYWFVQFEFPMTAEQAATLGKRNLTGKPYKSSGGPMVHHPVLKRKIPVGWTVGELADIANITMGQSPPGESYNEEGDGEVFFQGSTDFGWRYPKVRQYTTAATRIAHPGDILLSVRAPVGTLNIAPMRCAIGRGLSALNSKDGHDVFLFYVMVYFKQIFDRRNTEGTTFGCINRDDLRSLKLAIPPKPLLDAFTQHTQSGHEKIFNNHQQNQELTHLRDWLLPMLMNGQVKIG